MAHARRAFLALLRPDLGRGRLGRASIDRSAAAVHTPGLKLEWRSQAAGRERVSVGTQSVPLELQAYRRELGVGMVSVSDWGSWSGGWTSGLPLPLSGDGGECRRKHEYVQHLAATLAARFCTIGVRTSASVCVRGPTRPYSPTAIVCFLLPRWVRCDGDRTLIHGAVKLARCEATGVKSSRVSVRLLRGRGVVACAAQSQRPRLGAVPGPSR